MKGFQLKSLLKTPKEQAKKFKSQPQSGKSFRSAIKNKKAGFKTLKNTQISQKPTVSDDDNVLNSLMLASGMADAMENTTSSDFVLQAPDREHPNYLRCKVYFFETHNNMSIEIS